MSPDVFPFLPLLVKMIVAAIFVIVAAIAAERGGPMIGGLITTLPISGGASYLFLVLDHEPAFIAKSALSSLAINMGTAFYAWAFVLTIGRRHLVLSLVAALAAWLATAFILGQFELSLVPLIAANVIVLTLLHFVTRAYRDVAIERLPMRLGDLALRAILVAILVAAVVTLSFTIGPRATGFLAVFPILYTCVMVILYLRVGPQAAAAVVASGFLGLLGFGGFLITLYLGAEPLGDGLALAVAFVIAIAWNFSLYQFGMMRRRKATSVP